MNPSLPVSSLFAFAGKLPLPLLAIAPGEFYAVYLPMLGLLVGLIIAVFAMWTAQQNRRLKHETLRVALEKGQPIPEDLFNKTDRQEHRRHGRGSDDLRGGIVCLAVAGGLYYIVPFVAPLLAFIGIALLICWFIERNDKSSNSDRD